jgi:hypothetical protein
MRVAIFCLTTAALACALSSCREATEFEIDLSTDITCTSSVRDTAIFTAPNALLLAGRSPSATTATCPNDHGSLGSIVLLPSSGNDAPFIVTVIVGVSTDPTTCAPRADGTAPDVSGCIIARRQLSFVPHRSLHLPIRLTQSCLGIACAIDETCADGRCVPSHVQCSDDGCSQPPTDASTDVGAPIEASTLDASVKDVSVVDARSFDSGCPGTTPGTIVCGGTDCFTNTQKCCGGTCVPLNQACNVASYGCDEPSDCPFGQLCCVQAGPNNLATTQCTSTCTGGVPACQILCDCKNTSVCTVDPACKGAPPLCGGICPF